MTMHRPPPLLELGQVSTEYGAPGAFGPGPHPGIDIAVPSGTAVPVPVGGRLVRTLRDDVGGLQAIVETAEGFVQVFAHLDSVTAAVGDLLAPGDVVGLSGSSGAVTGPHVHYEVRGPRGAAVDPRAFVGEFGVRAAPNPSRAPDVNPVGCLFMAAWIGGGGYVREAEMSTVMRVLGLPSREAVRAYAYECGRKSQKSAPEQAVELAASTLATLRDPATWARLGFTLAAVALIGIGIALYAGALRVPALRVGAP